jgi:predicted nuclease with TOPRIM domain
LPAGELEKAVIDQVRNLIRHPDVIAHTYREVCAGSQTGPDPEVLAQLEELRQSRHQTYQAARSLLDLKDPDGPLVKSELKRLNEQMKSLDDRLDPIWEVLYPEEQSRILELLIETVRVSENNVDIRFRTNGIEKIVEELTSQGERSNG